MSIDYAAIIQAQIDELQQESAIAVDDRIRHLDEAKECEDRIARNNVKIEALEAVLQTPDTDNGQQKQRNGKIVLPGGGAKPKATKAVFTVVDQLDGATRDELLSIADRIASSGANKRHIVQTTIYQLKKAGKLVEDDGKFRRPSHQLKGLTP